VRALADQAQAAYEPARISISYTDLRAPIAGCTGAAEHIVADLRRAPKTFAAE
jgi:hypothetical protein